MKKSRIFYLDFIRVLSIASIVIYHFNVLFKRHAIKGNEILFTNHANGNLGNIGVSLFFIISGSALMYSYNEKFSLKSFFKRRFLSLYPMFWTAYSIFFLYLFYINRNINHKAENWTFIWTILGIDGYVVNLRPNFYILGEWFLGCIIILYLLFPLLRKLVIKAPKTFLICLIIFYIVFVQWYKYAQPIYKFTMPIDRLFITRILDLVIGMYFIRYIDKLKAYQFAIAIALSYIFLNVPIKIDKMYSITILGVVLFLVLVYISQKINSRSIQNAFEVLGKYSYAVFLVQHVIIDLVLNRFNNLKLNGKETLCLFIMTCVVIGVVAVYVHKLSNKITLYISKFRLASV